METQVRVPAPLPVPVDRALDLGGAALHGRQRVGHRHLAVVVRVDPDRRGGRLAHLLHDPRDVGRERAAVRVAQDQDVRPRVDRGRQHLHRVFRVVPVPVEEMLRVEEDLVGVLLQVDHRVPDGVQVLLEGGAKRLDDVEVPRLPDHRDDRGPRGDERLHVGVLVDLLPHPSGHPEGAHDRVLPAHLARPLEELLVLGVAAGVAALDVVDAELVQLLGDRDLVEHGEGDLFGLGPVPQRRVVQVYGLHPSSRPSDPVFPVRCADLRRGSPIRTPRGARARPARCTSPR